MKQRLINTSCWVLLLSLACLPACQQLKRIPLFNPEARPLNRIASANELITEVNRTLADYVQRGWLSQETVNKNYGPVVDRATVIVDESEVLIRAGSGAEGHDKVQAALEMLKVLRDQLIQIRKDRS